MQKNADTSRNAPQPNVLSGALLLLVDAVEILQKFDIQFVIVGGWSPYLLNGGPPLRHPGTRDVDVLVSSVCSIDKLKSIRTEFMNQGFCQSAKHEFQIWKQIPVLKHVLLYNVDFLHPYDAQLPERMFVKQMDMGIPLSDTSGETLKAMSIVFPLSDFVFKHKLITSFHKSFLGRDWEIPILTEAGTILSKSESVKHAKRSRDAFDIYVAIKQCSNEEQLICEMHEIKENEPEVYESLKQHSTPTGLAKLVSRVKTYPSSTHISSHEIKGTLEDFFNKVGL